MDLAETELIRTSEIIKTRELKSWETDWWNSLSDDGHVGWVSSTDRAEEIRTLFQEETGVKFIFEQKLGQWKCESDENPDVEFDFFEKKSRKQATTTCMRLLTIEITEDENNKKVVAVQSESENDSQIQGQEEDQSQGKGQGQSQEGQNQAPVKDQSLDQNQIRVDMDGEMVFKGECIGKALPYKVRFHDVLEGDVQIPCDGVPFFAICRYISSCVYGRNRHALQKSRRLRREEEARKLIEEKGGVAPKMRKCPPSKKVSCPARMVMKKVIRFPQFKTDGNLRSRRATSECLRRKLLTGEPIEKEVRVYVKFPRYEDHENHELVVKTPTTRKQPRLYKYKPNAPLATLSDLENAYRIVKESDLCVRTPMMHHVQDWMRLDVSCDLSLKLENVQTTGSFKVRGLANQLAHIPKTVVKSKVEVVTMSAGNYGKAFSFAMQQIGLKARVLMPDTAPQVREDIMKEFGATVERLPSGELQPKVNDYVANHRMHYLHPFDDIHLICGHGSVGFEILEEVPNPDIILVCCGGGGLLAGVAAAVKLSGRSDTKIYGVEPEKACCMYMSKQTGRAVSDPTVHSIASGLSPPFAGPNAYRHVARYVDDILLLSEAEIIAATSHLFHAGLVVEPAGAAAYGAILFGKVPDIVGKKVVAVITGGNVSPQELCDIV